MERYKIIDEPETKTWAEHLIVDPIIILFVAILVPLIWNPPFFGRFWIPMLWLFFNGYALGSPTLVKEVVILVVGSISMFFLIRGSEFALIQGWIAFPPDEVIPYVRTLLFGVFFLTLYLVIFRQSTSHALHTYLKGDDR